MKTPQTKATTRSRPKTENSLLEQRNRSRGIATEDMTSAFILPDITMRNPGEATMKLSTTAQEAFDRLASHEGKNCTICKRVIDHNAPHEHGATQKISIPKPVPVSERMPSPEPEDEDDVTMRPSQPPAIALATVMKGLEDELAHLKVQLARYQALYNQHDPSLSKRKRKIVYDKIEKVLSTMDTKADQIYALYDVLEGQKAAGHQMNEHEFEVTLQSVGIDIEAAMKGGSVTVESSGKSFYELHDEKKEQVPAKSVQRPVETKQKRKKEVWDFTSNVDEEEELPWEGFDPTKDVTGRSGTSMRSSVSN